jgi:hypothetical protein
MNLTSRGTLIAVSWLIALGIGLMIGRGSVSGISLSEQAKTTAGNEASRARLSASGQSESPDRRRGASRKKSFSKFIGSEEERQTQAMIGLSDILNTSNRVERTRQMLSFIDQVGDDEIAGVIAGFQEAGWVEFNRGEYSMLISTWMDRDPFAAIAFLDENEADGWTRKIAISAWASENPEAATNAIEGLEDEGKVNDWVVGLIEGMARNDPEGALRTLKDLPGGDTKWQAIRGILPEVVLRGAAFAGEWIEQIEEPKLQRDTAKRLAHSLAERDPESAGEWIGNITSVETRRDASEVVSEIYAQQDLEAAKEWTESLPLDTMTEAAEGVAKHLAREDPAAAAQWLLKLGDNPDLDGARIRFLREATKAAPQIALENVSTLSRANDQERYYRDILNRWKKDDQQAAIAWASEHSESLPPKVLRAILPKVTKEKKPK